MVVKFLNAFFLNSRRKKKENHGREERLLMGEKFHVGRDSLLPIPHVYATMKTMMCVFVLVDKRED